MIRRVIRSRSIWLAAALVAIMFDVFALDSTVLPHILAGVTPSGAFGYRGSRPEQTHATSADPAGAFEAEWAWAAYFTRSMKSGALPLWNPYQGLGQPQLANYVPALLFPVNWLTLVLPPEWWDLVFLTDWFLAAYFVCLLGRLFGFGRWGSLAGGVAVFSAGFFPAYLEVRSIVGTVASFPFLLYAIERSLRQPDWKWRPLALAASTYCVATGGHPSPALFALAFGVAYFAIRVALGGGRWLQAVRQVLPSVFLGGLLAAPLILTFAEYLLWDSLPPDRPARGLEHFPWRAMPMTVFPFLYGPMNMTIWGAEHSGLTWLPASVTCLAVFGLFSLRRRSALWAVLVPAAFLAAKNFGVPLINDLGRLPLMNQLTIFYSIGCVAVAVAVLAGAGVAFIIRRPVERWNGPMLVWILYAAAMTAIGVSTMNAAARIVASTPWRAPHYQAALASGLFWAVVFPLSLWLVKRRHPGRGDLLASVAVLGLCVQAAASYPSGSPDSFVLLQLATAGVFLAGAAGLLVAGRVVPMAAAMLVPMVLCGAAVASVTWTWPRLPDRYNPLEPAPYLSVLSAQPNAPRIHPLDGALNPDFGSALGLSSMTNIDNLVTRQGAAFISKFLDQGVFPARMFGLNAMRDPARPDPLGEFWAHKKYWDLIGVRYVLTGGRDPNEQPARKQVPGAPDLVFVSRDRSRVSVWQNPAAADRAFLAPVVVPVPDPKTAMARLGEVADLQRTVFVEGGACTGDAAAPAGQPAGRLINLTLTANRVDIDYDARTRGVLTLTDAHARGWRVAVDGQPATLLRVDGAFRGVCLDAPGRRQVTFVYRPPDWALALGLCGAGFVGVVALQVGARRRQRRPLRWR